MQKIIRSEHGPLNITGCPNFYEEISKKYYLKKEEINHAIENLQGLE